MQMARLRCAPWTPGRDEDPSGSQPGQEQRVLCLRRELSVRRKERAPPPGQLTCAAGGNLFRPGPSFCSCSPSPLLSLSPWGAVLPGAPGPGHVPPGSWAPGRLGRFLWDCVRFWGQIIRHICVVPALGGFGVWWGGFQVKNGPWGLGEGGMAGRTLDCRWSFPNCSNRFRRNGHMQTP